ncbi:hypothetical protein [Cupriavidus sp. D39]|uniref:hypothetical protein n=1 Tax=Cupriavidus sp. D39 TaxID=2997877 RepID=UPI0022722179|nr:hypothetical protein [Cupriavidus sp. D39]MCY0853918.1 hypothetical protein [Cupriavidus sp. D39]
MRITPLSGGADGFLREAGELIQAAESRKPDPEQVARLQQKYGLRYLRHKEGQQARRTAS